MKVRIEFIDEPPVEHDVDGPLAVRFEGGVVKIMVFEGAAGARHWVYPLARVRRLDYNVEGAPRP